MTKSCSINLLESALDGSLRADDEVALQHHLDECESCSAVLENMAGWTEWCKEASTLLTEDELDELQPSREDWAVDFTVEHLEPSEKPDAIGRLGEFDVLEVIGHGGMGVVLKAHDRKLNRYVAIKVLSPHLARNSLARKRFAREAQAAAAVVHPHVLAIHQVQPNGALPYLVMPLVSGDSVAERLTRRGTLELTETLRIGMQAAAGLSAAHEQGLVHRDVKPANILLEKGVERAVLTDFGLARAADDVTLTRYGIIAGTPQYMSPEQARGEALDGRSDLFSLGCVLYEMSTGVSPFRADSMVATMRRLVEEQPRAMESLNPELPPWFVAIVERLLEKDASRRYSTAKEVSELLEGCLAHVQQPANVPLPKGLPRSKSVGSASGQDSGRRRNRWGAVAAGVLLLGFGGAAASMFATAEPSDISGEWTGEGWSQVTLKQVGPAEYTGTYTDTFGKEPGKIELKWSRIERRYNGKWSEGKDRFGKISVRQVGEEIRGAWTTNRKSETNPGTPELADLSWVRPTADAKETLKFVPKYDWDDFVKQRNLKRLGQQESENLRNQWSKQRESIRTAEIRARYFLSGMQDIPRSQMEEFLAKLQSFVSDNCNAADVEEFVRKACPVAKQSWRKAVLSIDGKNWREQLGDEVRYGSPSHPPLLSALSLKSFWTVPSDELVRAPYEPLSNGRVRFEGHSENSNYSTVVDLSSGDLLEAKIRRDSIASSFEKHRYQGAFRTFSGISFPTVTVDIEYRDDKLYMIELFLVEDAKFNHPLKINDGSATENAGKTEYSFGPVIERTLTSIETGKESMMQLNSGDVLKTPEGVREFDMAMQWMPAHEADLVACWDGGGRGLRIVGGIAVGPGKWDASPKEVLDTIVDMEWELSKRARTFPDFNGPIESGFSNLWATGNEQPVFFIRTRQGTIGTLQITKMTKDPHTVTFRYKLLTEMAKPANDLLKPLPPLEEGRPVKNGMPIADAVRAFNEAAKKDPVGKDQPPLTEDELVSSVRWLFDSEKDHLSADQRELTKKVGDERVVPAGWRIDVLTTVDGEDGEKFRAWMIQLRKQGDAGKNLVHIVRQQLICQLDAAGKPMPLPALKKQFGDDNATPLAAAINEFNETNTTLGEIPQKPLMEEEVVAAIRWWKTRRNESPVPNGEFAAFQKIADTRQLPKGAAFELVPTFRNFDGSDFFIWSVRIRMPQESKAGWTFAYILRQQHVRSEGIEEKNSGISWGASQEDGLQAGVRLMPRKLTYKSGDVVTPVFYYRNNGKRLLYTSYPNLMTHGYYTKIVVVDAAGKEIPIEQDQFPGGPVGWQEIHLEPGRMHEVSGMPILLGDGERGSAETAIRAKPGQVVHVRFVLPRPDKENAKPIETGDAVFSIKAPEAQTSDFIRRRPAQDETKLTFGPVIERTVQEFSTGKNSCLSLESGEVLSPPGKISVVEQISDWARKYHVDLVADADPSDEVSDRPERRGLMLFDVFYARPASWDMTASEAAAAVAFYAGQMTQVNQDENWLRRNKVRASENSPTTLFFRNRDGKIGILEITGLTDNPRGVKIRYKLVKKVDVPK